MSVLLLPLLVSSFLTHLGRCGSLPVHLRTNRWRERGGEVERIRSSMRWWWWRWRQEAGSRQVPLSNSSWSPPPNWALVGSITTPISTWNQHHLELCIQSFPHRDRSITPHGHSTFCHLANPTPEANALPLVVIAVATTTKEETYGYQSSSAMLSPPHLSLFLPHLLATSSSSSFSQQQRRRRCRRCHCSPIRRCVDSVCHCHHF